MLCRAMHLLCGLVCTWCAQAVPPLCQVLRVKQSDGVGLQSDGAGLQSDGVGLQSDGVGLQSDGVGLQTLEVTVHRGERRLGMMLDDDNIVLEIKPNSPAQGLLQAGDQVLALDSVELAGRRLAQVLQPRPTHVFKVCRHVVKC